MKTSLVHLPKLKIAELNTIKDIILKYDNGIEMIILFGSYATGKWVYDKHIENGIVHEYNSDYDILVVTKSEKVIHNYIKWSRIDDVIDKFNFSTYATIIAHSIRYLNNQIEDHNWFFCDILKEGIMLWNSGNFELSKPLPLSKKRIKEKAQEDFDEWFKSANQFYETFEDDFHKTYYKKAAFELHQAAERYYMCFLIVFTGYKPRLHDLEKLGKRAQQVNKEIYKAFPQNYAEEKRLFDLLKRAYVGARYKKNYFISKDDLKYLSKRVQVLKEIVKKLCKDYIEKIKS